jgi:hypothetical protein
VDCPLERSTLEIKLKGRKACLLEPQLLEMSNEMSEETEFPQARLVLLKGL